MESGNISSVIRQIVDTEGVEVFLNAKRFCAYLDDLAVGARQESKVLRRALTDAVLRKFYEIYRADIADRQVLLAKIEYYLINELGFSAEWNEVIVLAFSDAFGWNYNSTISVAQQSISSVEEIQSISEEFKRAKRLSRTIAAGANHVAVVMDNGKVRLAGTNTCGQCYAFWDGIIAVAAGRHHTVGLKVDGTVVSTMITRDQYDYGQDKVDLWQGIVAIGAGDQHTVGLKKDGTVLAVGNGQSGQCSVESWRGMIDIAVSNYVTVGLRRDGTVAVAGAGHHINKIAGWSNIVGIAAAGTQVYGLKADGTVEVEALSGNDCGQRQVRGWKDIVAIAGNEFSTLGITSKGQIITTRYNGQETHVQTMLNGCNWKDIVAVTVTTRSSTGSRCEGTYFAAALDKNGRIHMAGDIGECGQGLYNNVRDFLNLQVFNSVDYYHQRIVDAEEKIKKIQEIDYENYFPDPFLMEDAKRGDPIAQLAVGDWYNGQYLYGLLHNPIKISEKYVPERDYQPEKALQWYLKAMEYGTRLKEKTGQFHYCSYLEIIGTIYYRKEQYEEAVKWYLKAVDELNHSAAKQLAYCYQHGKGVPKSSIESMKWKLKEKSMKYPTGSDFYEKKMN